MIVIRNKGAEKGFPFFKSQHTQQEIATNSIVFTFSYKVLMFKVPNKLKQMNQLQIREYYKNRYLT